MSDYVRQHQILQWTFIAAPDHPMLYSLANHIVRKVTKHVPKGFVKALRSDCARCWLLTLVVCKSVRK